MELASCVPRCLVCKRRCAACSGSLNPPPDIFFPCANAPLFCVLFPCSLRIASLCKWATSCRTRRLRDLRRRSTLSGWTRRAQLPASGKNVESAGGRTSGSLHQFSVLMQSRRAPHCRLAGRGTAATFRECSKTCGGTAAAGNDGREEVERQGAAMKQQGRISAWAGPASSSAAAGGSSRCSLLAPSTSKLLYCLYSLASSATSMRADAASSQQRSMQTPLPPSSCSRRR